MPDIYRRVCRWDAQEGSMPRRRNATQSRQYWRVHTHMARTPLMQALLRLASEHAEASERGISVQEVRDQRRSEISRRDLLKGAGALTAALALTDPFNLAGHMFKANASSPPRIAVIGGGIAGLNAALTL